MLPYVRFLKSDLFFTADQRSILNDSITYHAERAASELHTNTPIIAFGVSTKTDSPIMIPGRGYGGYTHSEVYIQIDIDPSKLNNIIEVYVPSIVCHEMHHATRMTSVGYGKTPLEVVVTEGLATIFEEEMIGGYTPFHGTYEEAEMQRFLVALNRERDDINYDKRKWMFGSAEFPRLLKYRLGAYIVREAKRKTPGLTATSLVHASADYVYELSKL